MSDPCGCQFCIDYKRFQVVLPLVPAEHREWFESIFDSLWNAQEELSYKAAVLDGSWPDSVEILEHRLANARLKQLKEEPPINFDCKVCEVCNQAMTSKQYWAHPCQQPTPEPEFDHACDVVDVSDGPCGDISHDTPPPAPISVLKPQYGPCDECGEGVMVERTNRNTGNTFLGCSEFPDCKHTKTGGANPAPARVSSYNYDDEVSDEDDGFYMGDHQGDFF